MEGRPITEAGPDEDDSQTSGSRNALEYIPNELFDMILWELDLASLKNFRLASRRIAAKSQSPGFKRFLTHKTTELTPDAVASTLALASHPVFGPAVKTLTMLVVFYDESRWAWAYRKALRRITILSEEAIPDMEGTVELDQIRRLGQMQNDLALWASKAAALDLRRLFARLGRLDKLILDTRTHQHIGDSGLQLPARDVPRGMNWLGLWKQCNYALRNVIRAMAHSGVRIASLSLFDGKESFPYSGKIQSKMLSAASQMVRRWKGGSLAWAHQVKSLTLGFSTVTRPPDTHDQLDHRLPDLRFVCRPVLATAPEARAPDALRGPADFLELLPGLEALDLRMYNTLETAPLHNYEVLAGVRLTGLRRLALRGVWTRLAHLVRLLGANRRLEALDLCDVHLGQGDTWDAALRFLSQAAAAADAHADGVSPSSSSASSSSPPPGPRLRSLHLENLWDGDGWLVHLAPRDPALDDGRRGPGTSIPVREGGELVYARDVGAAELAGGLEFATLGGSRRWRASEAIRSWLRKRILLYGPPDASERDGLLR